LSIRVQLNGERDRAPRLKAAGAHAKEKFGNTQIACRLLAYEKRIDKPEIVNWKELF
jgi:xylulose-5-phosphate/fructose-6-phosphate phosphoketolase